MTCVCDMSYYALLDSISIGRCSVVVCVQHALLQTFSIFRFIGISVADAQKT